MAKNESKTEQEVDLILEDWSAQEIKSKFDFMFQQFLLQSEGVAGQDLSEMFEIINRIADLFKVRQAELEEKEADE
ncbi:MAG: hypothetical protein LLF93_09385 [Bacteroidales bacterium]|nr:hypothetical protein [Bacteroidales bacterium]